MILTNNLIYTYAKNLLDAFDDGTQKLPIKINFYLQKNKKILIEKAQEIEQSRLDIAKEYGVLNPDKAQYEIPSDKMEIVQNELKDLFELEQEIQIYTIKLEDLTDDLSISTAQMEAMMFMIE